MIIPFTRFYGTGVQLLIVTLKTTGSLPTLGSQRWVHNVGMCCMMICEPGVTGTTGAPSAAKIDMSSK